MTADPVDDPGDGSSGDPSRDEQIDPGIGNRTNGGTAAPSESDLLLGTAGETRSDRTRGGLTGFRTLLRREVLRYVRRPRNTFLPPMITNVLYFAVFGIILGGRIDQIAGFDYIVFLLPGLIVLGTISNAFENASFSIFHGRWNEYIETLVISPLAHWMFVAAYVLASALRGILVGSIIAIIGLAFIWLTDLSIGIAEPAFLAAFMIVTSVLFAALGIIGGLWARDFDYLTVMNQFIVRPLVFFGGVFYTLDVLSPLYRTISLLNPMVYMVNGVRYGFLGYSDIEPTVALVVLAGFAGIVVGIDVWLFRRGYGLVD